MPTAPPHVDPSLFSPSTYVGPPPVPGVCWHYCTSHKARTILAAGRLEPHPQHVGALPLVWASTNPVWEPSCCKPIAGVTWMYEGVQVPQCLTFEDMQAFGTRLVRLALRQRDLPYNFPHACTIAKINPRLQRLLLEAGRALGADPLDWRATTQPIVQDAWVGIEVWQVDHWEEV